MDTKNYNETVAPADTDNNIQTQPEGKAPQFPFLLRRLGEFFITSIICSVPIALLYQFGIIPKTDQWAMWVMGLSLFVFIIMNGYLLRAFFYSMGNKRIYFNVNMVAYFIFSVINIAALSFLGDQGLPTLYAYIFMPVKLATVILKSIGLNTASPDIQLLAPLMTHFIMYVIILISPLEMYTFEKKKK